jgi:hypothetical protein
LTLADRGIQGPFPMIPDGSFKELLVLDLSSNEIAGPIPASINRLVKLNERNLGTNALTGSIPNEIGNMTELIFLNLESNQLEGKLPSSLVNLILLQKLNLRYNAQLTGPVLFLKELFVLKISGTDLYSGSNEPELPSSIPTETSATNNNGLTSGDSESAPLLYSTIAIAAGLAVLVLIIVTSVLIFLLRRQKRMERKNDAIEGEATTNEIDLMEMSVIYNSEARQELNEESNNNTEGLVFISKLSAGAFGEVWVGRYNGKNVAIKKMKFDEKPKDQLEFVQEMIDEAKIMKEMQHERVAKFINFDIKTFSIVMELMPRGALSSFIKKNKRTMQWSTRYQTMLDICEGMAFLQSSTHSDGSEKQELFHQDLKSANVLLTAEGGIIRAKIGDFGLSLLQQNDTMTNEVRFNGGTKCYQAPVSSLAILMSRN